MPVYIQLETIIATLESQNITASEFILAVLTDPQYKGHPVLHDILLHLEKISAAILTHPRVPNTTLQHASILVWDRYTCKICDLVQESSGWHFSAL